MVFNATFNNISVQKPKYSEKTTNLLQVNDKPLNIKETMTYDIEIEVLTWDRNKNVVALNPIMGSQISPLIIESSMIETDINKQ